VAAACSNKSDDHLMKSLPLFVIDPPLGFGCEYFIREV
jgi:hypothetical protein